MVRPERPDEIELAAAGHAGDLGTQPLGDLDRERPDVPGRADDEHLVAGADRAAVPPSEPLKREDSRMGQGRCVVERHAVGDRLELRFRGDGVLGECAERIAEQVREDAVPGFEACRSRADRLDDSRDIDPDAVVPRPAKPEEEPDELRSRLDPIKVGAVHRGCHDADQDLALTGLRLPHLFDADDVRRPVAIADGGFHGGSLPAGAPETGESGDHRGTCRGRDRRGSDQRGTDRLCARPLALLALRALGRLRCGRLASGDRRVLGFSRFLAGLALLAVLRHAPSTAKRTTSAPVRRSRVRRWPMRRGRRSARTTARSRARGTGSRG